MSRLVALVLSSVALLAACGGPPEPSTTVPPIPIGIATLCGNRQVTVSWTAMTGATSYDIYRSTASGTTGAWIGGASGTSFVDNNGLAGTTYYYTVKAVNGAGQSGASAQAAESFCRLMGGALQGKALSLTSTNATVSTFAGTSGSSGLPVNGGVGFNSRFNGPQGMTSDGTYLYVADFVNNAIQRIDPATQEVILFAGNPVGASGSADGVGTAATFFHPSDITSDGDNLYVADSGNCTVRRIVIATAAVSTFAGTAGSCLSVNGSGTAANFANPRGITTDGNSLFVTESTAVRRIDIASQLVTTFAGSTSAGHADGIGSAARFDTLKGITTDGVSLFAADDFAMDIRKIDIATATVTTYAGKLQTATSLDGTGTNATFNRPMGISSDGTNLYVVEQGGDVLRKIVIASVSVTTLAGLPATPGTTDGVGAAARFNAPQGITVYCGSLFIGDTANSSIRRIQ